MIFGNPQYLGPQPDQNSIFSPPQQPPPSFVWGQGGAQLSPEQIQLQQKSLLDRQKGDYSPIISPWQGLARVADQLDAGLEQRQLDKKVAASNAGDDATIAQLIAGSGNNATGAAPSSDVAIALARGLASPNPRVKEFTQHAYDRLYLKAQEPTEFERYLTNGGVQPGTPEWQKYNFERAQSQFDPVVNVTLPTGVFAGPRSMLPSSQGTAGTPGAPTTRLLPNGQTAYFVNGDWYDNPEGK